tara:strand:+ start:675 stop:2258 length:1584 start_codon:yes stop_codon:yes gene_type:complete
LFKLKKKLFRDSIFLILLGMATSLSLPPFNYFVINFFTFTFFFIFLYKKLSSQKVKKYFFLYGWLFGFGYFLTNLYWISISLTFDKSFKFLIPITIILIPAFLATFYGLVSYFFIILKTKKIINSFLIFSLLFSILEFIRGSFLTGFPWNLIAYSFLNQLEIISIISIIGTYGFNLFCISLFSCPALLILRESNKEVIVFISLIICLSIFYLYGFQYKKIFNSSDEIIYNYKIRAIGSSISLERFYSSNNPVSIVEELIKISKPNLDEKTIFIWPEGILPDISQEELIDYKWLFENKFSQNHILAMGINSQTIIDNSSKYFNTFSIYDNELNLINSYSKIKLVPFGEFLPFENFLSMIGLKSITNNYQSYSKGKKRKIIEIKRKNFSIKILPLICYEIIYSGEIFKENDFDLIINISEDGWFGKSIGPKQHFAHSIFRSIESGKYTVRSANNGTSAIINPIGVIEKSLETNDNGYIDLEKRKNIQPTVFSKFGNKIFGLIILLYIFLIFSISFESSLNRSKSNLKNK